ncbi:protein kinase [Microbacterium sp. H37-C3]|uniref:serine/threonine protein kinase n=1 Tax=Microbacterium sp. H37-C3 TaxID=3004354 RepID=UPI0022AF6764|nr:protein kinase [Microbacterium sp. H37-C3]MCZ4066072.1 protein kinase [Microbacterium sp. H37-C3]
MAELRRRSRPPVPVPAAIDGRNPDRVLSSSDRADVHLYRDAAGRKPVAVKVFRDPLGERERTAFAAAAARLIALTTHPSAATVHSADTTDDGRPYLVMEYCSRAALAETTSRRPMSVPETLRLLVRLCGAVETAHRSGIAHGRIRIENVLTTDYGWPAIVGFDSDDLLLRDGHDVSPRARATDVHGLAVAATELLTGRPVADTASPLEGIDSVPAELETLVLATLESTEAGRGPSAAEFGLELQRIESDCHLPVTHLDVREPVEEDAAATADAPPDEDERTVLASRRRPEGDDDDDDHTVLADRTVLAERRRGPVDDYSDERTVLAARRTGPDDDRTALAVRHAAEADDRTVLSARSSDPDDDHTRLVSRSLPGVQGSRPPQDLPLAGPDSEPTALVRRALRDEVVRGRVDTERLAVGPDADGERYRARAPREVPEVARVRVEAPVRQPAATAAKRRGNGTVIAVVGAGVILLGAAATAIVMIIGGGA